MQSIEDFLKQALIISVAREFLRPNPKTKIVVKSSLHLKDESINQEELFWLDGRIDFWVYWSPFKVTSRNGSYMFYVEHEKNPTPFHGNYGVYVDFNENKFGTVRAYLSRYPERMDSRILEPRFHGDPEYIPDETIYQIPVSEIVPEYDYDRLKIEIEDIVKIAREDNIIMRKKFGWTYAQTP